jgi:hypothetical protein
MFHKIRTPLRIWFMAACLIGHDRRGVSARFICREFAIRYDRAWLMCHRLRHALTDDSPDLKLDDSVQVNEALYDGRKQKVTEAGRKMQIKP